MSQTTRTRTLGLLLGLATIAPTTHAQPAVDPTTPDGAESGASPAEAAPTTDAEPPALAVEQPSAEVGDAEAPGDEEESLVPEGEEELMGAHSVGSDRIRFSPGNGLDVRSDDGAFRLQTRVRAQFLYTLSDDSGDLSQQLTARRVRLVFAGNFFGEDNRFKMELAVAPSDEGLRDNLSAGGPRFTPILDIYFEFRQLRDLSVRIGQYKLPSNRQRVISSGNLQMVDRALMNGEFTLDRDLAIDARSADFLGLGLLRYYAGVSIGRGRDAVGFNGFGMNYFARVEVLPFGMFDDYDEGDFERARTPRLSIGAMYAFQHRNRGLRQITSSLPADGGRTDYHLFIADAIFMYAGFSAMWEFAIRDGERRPGDAVDDMGMPIPATAARNGYGTMLQAGYLLPRSRFEVSGRYGAVRGMGGNTSLGDSSELGVGLSYYMAQHPFKIQMDFFRLWGGPGTLDDGANQFRIQLQGSI